MIKKNINRKFITMIKNIDYSYKLIIIVFYGIYLSVIIN